VQTVKSQEHDAGTAELVFLHLCKLCLPVIFAVLNRRACVKVDWSAVLRWQSSERGSEPAVRLAPVLGSGITIYITVLSIMAAGWQRKMPLLLAALLSTAGSVNAVGEAASPSSKRAADGPAFQSIADMPGCSSSSSGSSSSSRALMPELQGCSWKVQMQRHSARWYAFDIPQDAASNMSVVIMARAVSGQITM
jgi:hypothetical protein